MKPRPERGRLAVCNPLDGDPSPHSADLKAAYKNGMAKGKPRALRGVERAAPFAFPADRPLEYLGNPNRRAP
jgi:hypothetical protein